MKIQYTNKGETPEQVRWYPRTLVSAPDTAVFLSFVRSFSSSSSSCCMRCTSCMRMPRI